MNLHFDRRILMTISDRKISVYGVDVQTKQCMDSSQADIRNQIASVYAGRVNSSHR